MCALTWNPGRIEATIGYLLGTVRETVLRREHRACTIGDAARTVTDSYAAEGRVTDGVEGPLDGGVEGGRERRCGVATRLTLKEIATALRRREPEGRQRNIVASFVVKEIWRKTRCRLLNNL
jgi:hypothetical protein